jgi:hypothetical protein
VRGASYDAAPLVSCLRRYRIGELRVGIELRNNEYPPTQAALQPPCCKCMFQVFQLFEMNVASYLPGYCKNRSRCCNTYIKIFHLFQRYIASVLSRYCICFTHMLQVHVSNVTVFLDVYCICFIPSVSCFRARFGGVHGFLCAHKMENTRRSHVWAGGEGSPRVAFFLGSTVRRRHAHGRLGLGMDCGVKSARMQPQCSGRWFPFPPSPCVVI